MIEGNIFTMETYMFFTVRMQELRLLEAFSGKCSKNSLSYWLWKVAENVERQVVAT